MPKKGWKAITIHEDLWNQLKFLRDLKGFSSIEKLIKDMVNKYA